ncbi:MAG: tRNA (adenosine(37)-N6)-threonylcarbamoyltransferase complex dimerization subunit type 1 TsaB [Bacteroidales bacterium]|nr:tRNA (adenosine(37)-N6)-threonylcarbamoyltransferase complex dimerization subunit type 1 TsaB [Bacteroidales bacterium]
MAKILLIETSGPTLSVAIADGGRVLAERVCTEPRMQASLTAPLVKEVLDALSLTVSDCDAVCVSKGPGSYTGLRVGVSTAKGLCFGASLPLIAIGTLDILASGHNGVVVPMIDARRMEVYTAVYNAAGERLTPIEAKVIGPESFADELAAGPVLFIGDGALKCKDVLTHPNARFREAFPLASAMAPLAEAAYNKKQFEDLAYFEPFYLKEFVAALPKVHGL